MYSTLRQCKYSEVMLKRCYLVKIQSVSVGIQIWTLFYMIWGRRDVILVTSRNDVNKTDGSMSFPAISHLLVTIRRFILLHTPLP